MHARKEEGIKRRNPLIPFVESSLEKVVYTLKFHF